MRISHQERSAIDRSIRLFFVRAPADFVRMADLGATSLGIDFEGIIYRAATIVVGAERASEMSDAQIEMFFPYVSNQVKELQRSYPEIPLNLRQWRNLYDQ